MAYLDKTGLTYFWGKIKTLLSNKSDVGHNHTEYLTNEQLETILANYPNKTELLNEYLGGKRIRYVNDVNDGGIDGYLTVKKG